MGENGGAAQAMEIDRSRSATAPAATRRQTKQARWCTTCGYSSTLVVTILLPLLHWFSSTNSNDKRFEGNKLSNCSRRPRLGGGGGGGRGGGAPSHQQQFRKIARALQRRYNHVLVNTLFALPWNHHSPAMKPDCPHNDRGRQSQSQEGPQSIGETQCDLGLLLLICATTWPIGACECATACGKRPC